MDSNSAPSGRALAVPVRPSTQSRPLPAAAWPGGVRGSRLGAHRIFAERKYRQRNDVEIEPKTRVADIEAAIGKLGRHDDAFVVVQRVWLRGQQLVFPPVDDRGEIGKPGPCRQPA